MQNLQLPTSVNPAYFVVLSLLVEFISIEYHHDKATSSVSIGAFINVECFITGVGAKFNSIIVNINPTFHPIKAEKTSFFQITSTIFSDFKVVFIRTPITQILDFPIIQRLLARERATQQNGKK